MTQPAMMQQPATAPTFNPFDPAHLADPYPGYRLLRETDPVHHHRGDGTTAHPDFWALSRYADVDAAVCDPGTFSSASGLTFYRDEPWHWLDRDGSMWKQRVDTNGVYDKWYAHLVERHELATDRRNTHGRLDDLIES